MRDFNDEINLTQISKILRRRSKLILLIIFLSLISSFSFNFYKRIFSPIFRGSFSFLIEDPLNKKSNKLSDNAIEQLAFNRSDIDIPTLIQFLKSPVILSNLTTKYNLSYKNLRDSIGIATAGGKTSGTRAKGILDVTVFAKKYKTTKNLTKDLSQLYLKIALEQRQQRLYDGLKFLNDQEPELTKKTNLLQNQLADFRERNELLEPGLEGVTLKEQELKIQESLSVFNSQREKLLLLKNEIELGRFNVLNMENFISETNSPTYSEGLKISPADTELLAQINILKAQLSEARFIYKPESKIIKNIESRIESLKPLILKSQLSAVNGALNLNEKKINSLKNREKLIKVQFSQQPELIKQFESLNQRLIIAQSNLSSLIAARENFQLEIAQNSLPWKIIKMPTTSKKPVRPDIPRNLVAALFIGLFFGFIAAIIRDKFDDVFHNISEVKEEFKDPILTEIPFIESIYDFRELQKTNSNDDNLLGKLKTLSDINNKSNDYVRFFYQEAFRNLCISVDFLNSDNSLKVITLTSSIPKEGKSTINVILSKVFGELDKKILLVDCDLRKSNIHKLLGLNNITGLSNFLTDNSLKWRDVVQNVPGETNIKVITAGRTPPDPARLLNSQKMKNFLDELRDEKEFDYVILDSPPLIGISDSLLLSNYSDGLILIITTNLIKKRLVSKTKQIIEESEINCLGIIANSMKETRSKGKGYGYGYGYNYGYENGYNQIYSDYISTSEDSTSEEEKIPKDNIQKIIQEIMSRPLVKKALNILDKAWKIIDD